MKKIGKHVSPIAALFLLVTLITVVMTLLAESSSSVADTLNVIVLASFRETIASVSDLFPISLFEILIILLPLILGVAIFFAVRRFRRGTGILRYLVTLVATIGLLFSLYQLTIGIAYDATPVGDRLGIEDVEVNEDILAETLDRLVGEINGLSEGITYTDAGPSDPGYTLDDISALVLESYEKFSELEGFQSSFDSRAKPMIFSSVMTMLELTGIYFPYTGEANVNTLYPTYDLCFTAAHELSHQRGIMRENEANLMAFLLCYTSDDPYMRYSAAMNVLAYIGNALYRTDEDRYYSIVSGLADGPRADLAATRAVSEQYENSFLADLSERVNDWFLKSNGTPGVVSYGMVVELVVAYLAANPAE